MYPDEESEDESSDSGEQERERCRPARFTFTDLQRSEQSVGPTNILPAESSARLFLFVSR